MSEPAPHLRLVDPATGELTEYACPNCRELADQLDGAHKEIRAWRTRYANLKRDEEADARVSELWPHAAELFTYWKVVCRHPRSEFTLDRFRAIEPHLRDLGPDMCAKAIEGAAFDPFVTRRRNGTRKQHNDWLLIFRSRDKVEEFANRAPAHGSYGMPYTPERLRIKAEVILETNGNDYSPQVIHDAVTKARAELEGKGAQA